VIAHNVGAERYCPRVATWQATWGPREQRSGGRCAECGADVVYNPPFGVRESVRLVCIDCLTAWGARQ
jgi:hypothetical protein